MCTQFTLSRLFTATLLGFVALVSGCVAPTATAPEPEEAEYVEAFADGGEFLFCFWNAENFFDDRNDNRPKIDEPYDTWFATDKEALEQKLEHLCRPLLKMNQGRGPDILALIEVEGVRAAELLLEAMNKRLADPKLHYKHVVMKELNAGRHIAPALITRLPVVADRTRLLGKRQRILQGNISVNGHELIVITSHWTSRLTDEKGDARNRYADQIYGAINGMVLSNRKVDVLLCGDFNDPPDADSVTKHLHATGNMNAVKKKTGDVQLLNLLANKDPKQFGTHYYRNWWIFDQIVVSPGMLDATGWNCDPKSIHVENTLHKPADKLKRPWRFGDSNDKGPRGYSDHFPVTVKLRVQGA